MPKSLLLNKHYEYFILKFLFLIPFLFNVHCNQVELSLAPPSEALPPLETTPPVQENRKQKLDLLIVIDNSLSMASRHKTLAEKLKGFSEKLDGIDYQIAVTTADSKEVQTSYRLYSKAWAQFILKIASIYVNPILLFIARYILFDYDSFDSIEPSSSIRYTPDGFGGKLIQFNGENFISPSTYNGENLILESLDRSSEAWCNDDNHDDNNPPPEICSSNYTEPIKVIRQFLRKKNTHNQGFLRDNSLLVALIITDEDLTEFEHKNKNITTQLQWIKDIKPQFKAYGITAQKEDIHNCQANWSGITSTKIQEFIKLSGGKHHSICNNSYTSIFDSIVKDL